YVILFMHFRRIFPYSNKIFLIKFFYYYNSYYYYTSTIYFMFIDINFVGAQHQANVGDMCISDCGTTNTILKSKKYFSKLKPTKGTVSTISGPVDVIEGIGIAHFLLPNGANFLINNALF